MQGDRGPDYVYFERKPAQFGETIAQKSTAAKMRLELYYKETVEGVVGRKERYVAGAVPKAGTLQLIVPSRFTGEQRSRSSWRRITRLRII